MGMPIYECLSQCIQNNTKVTDLVRSCMSECEPQKYSAPLIWVGFYIAGASLVCVLAMATDLFSGLLSKKCWFPCKFFTLNAAISAVLAIALKMPVDLSTSMPCGRDQLMKLSGTALMSVSMGNFMPSLAVMSDPELFANLMALALFIVPLISNICIQIGTGVIYEGIAVQHVIIVCCIVFQFALLVSTAIASPTMKKSLDSRFKEDTSRTSHSQPAISKEIRKHWVMSQSSNPQFVVARSVICTASGSICLITVLVLAESAVQLYITMSKKFIFVFPSSDYEWSANFIVLIQAAAVLVGSISPIFRWFTIVWFKFAVWPKSSFRDLFNVEGYWTDRLTEMKEFQLGLDPRHVKFNKFIRDVKTVFLDIFIKFQTFTVLFCRFLCLCSLLALLPYLFIYKIIFFSCKKKMGGTTNTDNWDPNWVLTLDKEPQLPKSTISKILSVVDGYVNRGKKKTVSMKPALELLRNSNGFDGIKEFNNNLIEKLTKITIKGVSNRPNDVWSMRIVTLSTIVCSIQIPEDHIFASMVNNILPYVRYIEKALGSNRKDIDPGSAAMDVWLDVYDSKKWLKDTKLPIQNGTSFEMKLERLRRSSEEYITKNENDRLKVLAAKWMSQTVEIFLENGANKEIDQQQLYDKLSRLVSDILVACLVNLEKAITLKISNTPIEKRELVVKEAASILGETEDIRTVAEERLSSMNKMQDGKEYAEASWWKFVIKPQIPLEGAMASAKASLRSDEHSIDVKSESK